MMNQKLKLTSDSDADPVSALVDGLNKLTLPNKNTNSETIKEQTDGNPPALRQLQSYDRGKDHTHLRHTRIDPQPRPKVDQDHRGKKQSSQSGRINANRDLSVGDLSVLSSKYTGHPNRNRHSKEDAYYTQSSSEHSSDRSHQGACGWGNLEPEGAGKRAEGGEQQQEVLSPRMGGGSQYREPPSQSDRRFADSKLACTEDSYQFDPSAYPENERHDRFLQFLEKCAPSKTRRRSDGIGRIRVLSPSHVEKELDQEGLETAWKNLTDSKDAINFSDVKDLAVSYGFLRGIWLLFVKTGNIDRIWKRIASATVKGKLGTDAKVTPIDDSPEAAEIYGHNNQVISVYTKNFTDYTDVIAIERKIRYIYQSTLSFKPGIYAELGLYSRNKYGLKPGIYISEWNAKRKMSNIRSNID